MKDAIQRRHFGLPVELGSAGVLPWDAVGEIATGLNLAPGGLLVDVACGRGGYGIELALRCNADLLGIDFSTVALDEARRIAVRRLPEGRAAFQVATLTSTDVPDATADALICTDSVQFADPPATAMAEFRRVLRSGGRLVLTTWRPTTPGDPRLGPRLRDLDPGGDLDAAGFRDIVVADRPHWRAAERGMWEEAVATSDDGRDLALASLRDEGRQSLAAFDSLERVIAFATAP